MSFLFCPRLRSRQTSDSSDLGSYQLARIGSSSPSGSPRGILSPTDEQSRPNRCSGSSGGLSGKIRRRFSRDARDMHRRPQRPERGPKAPFLHFASKHPVVHAVPVASHDIGSSLMSERGYDSDAQYIATPNYTVYTAEHLANRPRNGMANSTRGPLPSRDPDLEPSREQTFGLTIDNRTTANEQPPYYGEGGVPQLSWHSRDHEYRTPQAIQEPPSSVHKIDIESSRGRTLSPCTSVAKAWAQERPVMAPIVRVQETHRQHTAPASGRSPMPIGSFEDGVEQRGGYGHDAGAVGYPGHHLHQQQTYTTSADSLGGCPPQLSVRKRHQRPRREMTPDEQSVHLAEMNIPRMLASSSSTSNLIPHNYQFDNYPSTNNAGPWTANRYQALNIPMTTLPVWDASEARLATQPTGFQGLGSPNSSKTSLAGYDFEQNVHDYAKTTPSNMPAIRTHSHLHSPQHGNPIRTEDTRRTSNIDNALIPDFCAGESNVLKSKFTERFGSDRSVNGAGPESHGSDDANSPRKISIGWMSEGRRVGYGYTLVPPENTSEEHDEMHHGAVLPGNYDSSGYHSKGSPVDNETGNADKYTLVKPGNKILSPSKTNDSGFDISAILQRLNLPRWTGTGFGPKASNASDAGSCESGGSSLFGILSNRKKKHDEAKSSVEVDNPWEFCSWVRPVPSSNGQQVPQPDLIVSRDHAEAQLIEKLTTLRRRGSAWAARRKVSDIARNLEKRADRAVSRLAASTDQFPVVQRTATRVLRLRGPGSKELPRRVHDDDPVYSTNQFDGPSDFQRPPVRSSERASLNSSDDWDSLYEECLEERSIPE